METCFAYEYEFQRFYLQGYIQGTRDFVQNHLWKL